MNLEFIAENAKKGDFYSILLLKQFSKEFNHFADKILENIYFDGNKENAVGKIYLREGITEIKSDEFRYCEKLEKIILPKSLISIGNFAFCGCKALKEIIFPENLNSIGYSAFYDCNSLEKINLPENLNYIGEGAFYKCSRLKKIIYHRSTEKILKKYFGFKWNDFEKIVID